MQSAYVLAMNQQAKLACVWFQDWALNAGFHQLFEPIESDNMKVREAEWYDLFTVDRPRRHNLYIPSIYQKVRFDMRIYEQNHEITENREELMKCVSSSKELYMASYSAFMDLERELLLQLFRPVDEICGRIAARKEKFTPHTIGLHIRRTDHLVSIQESPLELFYPVIEKEIEAFDDAVICLATDEEEVKHQLISRYGQRILSTDKPADRNSVEGIRDAVADMFALADTKKIFGTAYSSFSEMAALLGGISLTVIKK